MGKFIKRLFDFILALILFIPGAIVLLLGMLFVKIVSPESSPIFKQVRVGYKNKHFTMYKLRSMTNERDAEGNLLPDEQRLTKVGKFVRSTSVDELPQLINVLKGDMSFIGPRPLYVNFLKLYDETQARRHEVRPGISGWAQVH